MHRPFANGTPGNAEGNHVLTVPLAVTLPRARRRYLDITFDSDDRYRAHVPEAAGS